MLNYKEKNYRERNITELSSGATRQTGSMMSQKYTEETQFQAFS
jgi:hypothetical protein